MVDLLRMRCQFTIFGIQKVNEVDVDILKQQWKASGDNLNFGPGRGGGAER